MPKISDPEKKFRLATRGLYLTYSQCPATKEEALAAIQALAANKGWELIKYLVGQERHEDGGFHLHCFFKFHNKLDITNVRLFDLESDGIVYHPNIQGAHDERRVKGYCKKEGDYISNFFNHASAFAEALAAPSAEEAEKILREREPRFYLASFGNINACLKHIYKAGAPLFPPRMPPADAVKPFHPTPEMVHWLTTELPKKDRPLALMIVGDSRTGKTSWARSLMPHMYFKASINWDMWNEDAPLLILDDFVWKDIPMKKELLTCMGHEISYNPKYGKIKTVKATQHVILLNNHEDIEVEHRKDGPFSDYWSANLMVVRLPLMFKLY